MNYFKSSDGLNLGWRESGSGRPLLCLAGMTRNSGDFDYLAARLDGVRMIMMDYRGRGRSDWDPDPANYTPVTEARDAVELLDHLGVSCAPVLGTSRGGVVAMCMAAMNRRRISGALLNDIGPEVDQRGISRLIGLLASNRQFSTHREAAEFVASEHLDFEGVPVSRWLEDSHRMFATENGKLVARYDPQLRESLLAALTNRPLQFWDLFAMLCGMPTGVIRGANSDLLSARTVEQMKARRPDLLAVEVPGRGHCPFLDEPESLAIIGRFLAAIP